MRRIAFLAAALLAAGCQVETEGAACDLPGATDQCPSGQACGNDGKCSTRAASCAETRCEVGAKECRDGAPAVIAECRGTDPVCGVWETVETCATGLVCGEGAAACACPLAASKTYYFDPERSGDLGVEPTGAPFPAECQLPSLEDALAAASAAPGGRAVAGAGVSSHALGATLEIPEGVTLAVAAPDVAKVTLAVGALDAATRPAVVLHAGSALEGYVIRNEGATQGRAIEVACDAGAPARLAAVEIAAEKADVGRFTTGVHVAGACGLEASDLAVAGASAAGLRVETPRATGTSVANATLSANGEGVHLRSGALTLRDVVVADNAGAGILAGESAGGSELDVERCTATRNGDSGMVLFNNSRIRLVDNTVTANEAASTWSAVARKVGGLVFRGDPPPPALAGEPPSLLFHGNTVTGNSGDQVLVYLANGPWLLDGGDCESLRNTFSCYDSS
ncbi:MAG TPA: right-handed parallel beta-helix repeat-containing protein, partial [Anaeromyxobacteraceae bacterium]|nr:right-handed parallel beta-helix repeat-containing protein [Anaeromyxobacteraceae bacterium]